VNSDLEDPLGEATLEDACTSWNVHLVEFREDITALIPALRRFLEEKFMVWFNVLGIVGAIMDPVLTLNKTISWLRKVRLGFTLKHPPALQSK